MKKTLFFLAAYLVSAYVLCAQPARSRNNRPSPRPASLPVSAKESRAALNWQLEIAKDEKLTFIANDRIAHELRKKGELVPLPTNRNSVVDPRLGKQWRYATPQVIRFLNDFGAEVRAHGGRPIQVNSAMRTPSKQNAIRQSKGSEKNVNATTSDRSSHMYGSTIDIAKSDYLGEKWSKSKKRMVPNLVYRYTDAEFNWMRKRLLELERQNLIEFNEEIKQSVFHIMVRKHYGTKRRLQ